MSEKRPEVLDQIKILLRRDLKLGPDIPIPDDMPFFGTEADFDSLDILLLLTSLEKQFHIKIPSEAVGKEVFQNLGTLAAYVQAQIDQPAATPDYLDRLPHREPFRFISRVHRIDDGTLGEAVWSVTGNEPFFPGHFPGNPVVPGVLIAEALAQLSGLVGLQAVPAGKLAQLDVRFDQPVTPPADITLHSMLLRKIGELQQFEVTASVNGATVARGTLTLSRPAQAEVGQ